VIVAIFKMLGFFLLIFLIVILLFVFNVLQKLFGKGAGGWKDSRDRGTTRTFGSFGSHSRGQLERCPSCQQPIMVGKQPGHCPKCNTPLGRNHEGKLLIRVN
jgi:uncharacterized paraquat-inducible protein A